MVSCLMEVSPLRKNKITLSDYDYHKDIENRLLMSQFSSLDIEVLEEILYSSIQVSIRKLAKSLETEEAKLYPSLEKLSKTGLFTYSQDTIFVDKEMRKYFEAQILKFDEDFIPGMEYLQSLLKKVPIHVLPAWYSIPRTSNNIFDSLIEKYLLTPQIFQRYLMELNLGDPVLKGIIDDVYQSDSLEMTASDIVEKYNLTKEQFEEHMLHLEFNFVCCLGYKKVDDDWIENVTPFHEWREYVSSLRLTEVNGLDENKVKKKRPYDFSFVQDLAILLEKAKKQPLMLETTEEGYLIVQKKMLQSLLPQFEEMDMNEAEFEKYVHTLISKLRQVKLADVVDKRLCALELAHEWLDMRLESRAMFLYRHPLNKITGSSFSASLWNEKSVRETEKSLVRALNKGWVLFEDFLKGVHAPITDEHAIMLKRTGRNWKYSIPCYSDVEKQFIKAIIFEWLFEAGLVQVGTYEGKDCFLVTSLGHSLFAR